MATIRITRDGAGASRLSATCRSLGVRLGWWVGTSGSPACYATRLKLDALSFNPHFPVNTLQLMRGAVAAEAEGALAAYVEAVFQHMWEQPKKMDDPEVIRVALTESGLDAEHLLVRAQDQRVKDALAASTQRAVERRAFGVPTFFVGSEMFFGKDRLRDVEEEIARQAARSPTIAVPRVGGDALSGTALSRWARLPRSSRGSS